MFSFSYATQFCLCSQHLVKPLVLFTLLLATMSEQNKLPKPYTSIQALENKIAQGKIDALVRENYLTLFHSRIWFIELFQCKHLPIFRLHSQIKCHGISALLCFTMPICYHHSTRGSSNQNRNTSNSISYQIMPVLPRKIVLINRSVSP